MPQTVLLAGATGMLGGRVAHHLLAEPDADLRLLLRPGTLANAERKAAISPLLDRGAQIVEGDLADPRSLDNAPAGVDVIVSAVQGGPDVVIDGQLALLEAAGKSGVRRFLPSDFALDLFDAPEGEHALYDTRRGRQGDRGERAGARPRPQRRLHGYLRLPNLHGEHGEATVSFWGEGDERFGATSVDDTARYTAKAAVDRGLSSGKFAIAGQKLSLDEVTAAFERVTGRTFRRERRGSVEDLRAWITDKRANDPDPMAAVIGTYQLHADRRGSAPGPA